MSTTPTTPTGELGVTLSIAGRVEPSPTALCAFLLDTVDKHRLDPMTITVCSQQVWSYPADGESEPPTLWFDLTITGAQLPAQRPHPSTT